MSVRVIIDAERPPALLSLAEIVRHRELLYMLAARDIKVRYRQAVIGIAWAIAQPVVNLALFLVLFGWLKKHPVSDSSSYALSAICGLIPWQFMANVMLQSTASLVSNRHVITKVYFPRALIPLAVVGCGLFDLMMSSTLLVGFLIWHQVVPGWHLMWLGVWVPLLLITASGLAMWLSALNALYRDFGFVVPFAVQIGLFASPVIYESSALVPAHWRIWLAVNPLTGILEGLRTALLGNVALEWHLQVVSGVAAVALFVSGSLFFSRVERTIADRI